MPLFPSFLFDCTLRISLSNLVSLFIFLFPCENYHPFLFFKKSQLYNPKFENRLTYHVKRDFKVCFYFYKKKFVSTMYFNGIKGKSLCFIVTDSNIEDSFLFFFLLKFLLNSCFKIYYTIITRFGKIISRQMWVIVV